MIHFRKNLVLNLIFLKPKIVDFELFYDFGVSFKIKIVWENILCQILSDLMKSSKNKNPSQEQT
ncbi:hypothetical protein BpHYR1_010982 [Brachionus plicatilis]|uniref:Uncharacterized protein n=1 Tax=Brachionus plicatilis TaxID=10195 RepID=A0A3M7T0Y9_BRAPC|nr:hypothetical protein BpHYR1_010982 [Brachionus plicatilis]